jgi:hypothetical protein
MTITELAVRLGVDEGDIRVLLAALGADVTDALDPDVAASVEAIFDPDGERTAAMT